MVFWLFSGIFSLLPSFIPCTAYHVQPHLSCTPLCSCPGSRLLAKPGRISVTWCHTCDASLGPPSAQEMLSAFFPPWCSSLESRASYDWIQLTSWNIPAWFQPLLLAMSSHRQRGYATVSNRQGHWVSSCKLPKLFMPEQRSLSSTIGNYAHSSPLLFFIQFVVSL